MMNIYHNIHNEIIFFLKSFSLRFKLQPVYRQNLIILLQHQQLDIARVVKVA